MTLDSTDYFYVKEGKISHCFIEEASLELLGWGVGKMFEQM